MMVKKSSDVTQPCCRPSPSVSTKGLIQLSNSLIISKTKETNRWWVSNKSSSISPQGHQSMSARCNIRVTLLLSIAPWAHGRRWKSRLMEKHPEQALQRWRKPRQTWRVNRYTLRILLLMPHHLTTNRLRPPQRKWFCQNHRKSRCYRL